MSITNITSTASMYHTDKAYMHFNPGVRRFVKNRYSRTIRHNWLNEVTMDMTQDAWETEQECLAQEQQEQEAADAMFWNDFHDNFTRECRELETYMQSAMAG